MSSPGASNISYCLAALFATSLFPSTLAFTLNVRNKIHDLSPEIVNDNIHLAEDLVHASQQNNTSGNSKADLIGYEEQCDGCDFTIDMRCSGQKWRHAYYHRITDCLLPMYGLVAKAREASGERCILTWKNGREINIEPFLGLLAGDLKARIIYEDVPCATDMDYYSAEPSFFLGARREYVSDWPTLPHIVGRVELDLAANMKVFQEDAWRVSGPARTPRLIFIARRNTERSFWPESESRLQDFIQKTVNNIGPGRRLDWYSRKVNNDAVDLQYSEYVGNESLLETIKMFTYAVGVVGYHGAGFVNTLFASHPVCIKEITTFVDLEDTTIWRTNSQLVRYNPFLVWETYTVQLQQMLRMNKVKLDTFEAANDKNQFIKSLPYAYLSYANVEQLGKQFVKCLERHVF